MLEYFYAALRSKFGIEIEVSDQEIAKRKLYAARKEANDPALETISIRVPPNNPRKLWLIHNGKEKGTVPPTESNSKTV